MSNQDTLERVADLLPADRREAFFACIARFKNVPEDDEYLQILEAIGFMTMIWSEVPNQVRTVLENSNPVTETSAAVGAKLAEAVREAIPSYDDLSQVTDALKQHQLALKQTLAAVSNRTEHRVPWTPLLIALLVGIALGIWSSPAIETLRSVFAPFWQNLTEL